MYMKSRKLFAMEMMTRGKNPGDVVRVPVAENSPKYNSEIHILPSQDSDYLAVALKGVPYGTIKTDDKLIMEDLMQNGKVDKTGRLWVSFFAFWKDRQGHAFMCPKDSGISDPSGVGVITKMTGPDSIMKVGKYTNRLFAALIKDSKGESPAVWGSEVDWVENEQTALIQVDPHSGLSEDERLLSVLYVDLKTLTKEQKALGDGCIAINAKAAKALGLSRKPRKGMAWRGTLGTQRGLGKGHIMYVPDMQEDVVIYGPKTVVKTERFFFGSMGRLHVGIPHTDRQAFVNFQFHRRGLAGPLATTYMREVIEMTENEELIRQLLLLYTKDLEEGDIDQDAWILRRALRYGISFLRYPGLYRRVCRYLMEKVLACDSRARIPMAGKSFGVALYSYVLPDINVIGKQGEITPERGIPAGYIVCPDLEPGTEVICYRQPSEHSNAWVSLIVADYAANGAFAGSGICMLGQGALEALGRLGGADMDDQFVIVHDPVWVAAFHSLRPYPEVLPKISADTLPDRGFSDGTSSDEYSDLITDEMASRIWDTDGEKYTNRHVSWQIQMSDSARAGIGPVVNFGMIDMLLSDPDQKASLLADMVEGTEQYDWLVNRPDYQAAKLMTNLELVIDGNVKDRSLLEQLGDVAGTISRFHRDCLVYPESMVSRIPTEKRKGSDYVVAKSLTCRALASIRSEKERMMNFLTEREWSLVAPASRDLIMAGYAFDNDLHHKLIGHWVKNEVVGMPLVRIDNEVAIKTDIWDPFWARQFSQDMPEEKAYEHVMKLIRDELADKDADYMKRLAVQLYYNTYKKKENPPRINPRTGKYRGFADGLLWSPAFGGYFIDALREAKIAGYYTSADLAPQWRARLGDVSTLVAIKQHQVFIQDELGEYNIRVGEVAAIALHMDAVGLRMDAGLVEYRRSGDMCQPSLNSRIIVQRPLVRIYPPDNNTEVVKPQVEQVEQDGTFGAILKKALNVLNK